MAQPRGTLNGHFRVTEQGEMITQHFGHAGIAVDTLDIYTAGVLHYMWVLVIVVQSAFIVVFCCRPPFVRHRNGSSASVDLPVKTLSASNDLLSA